MFCFEDCVSYNVEKSGMLIVQVIYHRKKHLRHTLPPKSEQCRAACVGELNFYGNRGGEGMATVSKSVPNIVF